MHGEEGGKTGRARRLRQDQTAVEEKLWQLLRRERLGVKFRRQHPVGPYFADFACIEKGLIVELDGGQHGTEEARAYDAERTAYLNAAGFKVLRFWNNEVTSNLPGVLEIIKRNLNLSVPPPLSLGERAEPR